MKKSIQLLYVRILLSNYIIVEFMQSTYISRIISRYSRIHVVNRFQQKAKVLDSDCFYAVSWQYETGTLLKFPKLFVMQIRNMLLQA